MWRVFMEFLWNANINILNLCRFWESCSCVKILAFLFQGVKNLPKNLLSSVYFCFVFFFPFLLFNVNENETGPIFCGIDIYLYELLGLMISMFANVEGARSFNQSSEVFPHVHIVEYRREKDVKLHYTLTRLRAKQSIIFFSFLFFP